MHLIILNEQTFNAQAALEQDQLPALLVACRWCSAGQLAALDVAVWICPAGAASQWTLQCSLLAGQHTTFNLGYHPHNKNTVTLMSMNITVEKELKQSQFSV